MEHYNFTLLANIVAKIKSHTNLNVNCYITPRGTITYKAQNSKNHIARPFCQINVERC